MEAVAGVIVLGAGRSGTSAITRAFLAAGFFAGHEEELLGPAPSNPVGHYEPLPVLRTNEQLLERLASGAPPREEQLALADELAPQLRAVLDDLIAKSNGAPLAIKEPRINRLLPVWGPVIDGVLHPVLAVRDPLEVATSMSHRYGTPVAHALALWEVQTTHALAWLDGRTATIAPYRQLVGEPGTAEAVVRCATSHVDPDQAGQVRPEAARPALQPELRTQSADKAAHPEYLTQRQAELWEYLDELPAGDAELAVPEPLQAPSGGATATVRTEDERVQLIGHYEALSKTYEEEAGRTAALEREVGSCLRELEGVKSSLSWRVTSPMRRLSRRRQG